MVKTKLHPGFSPEEGITPAEFKALSEYAEGYNVELIGSFQSLGHFKNILAAPEYRDLGITDRMLRPADPAAINFLQEVYAEMQPAFSSDFFNINADEAWDLVRGDMKPLTDSVGVGKVFSDHANPLLKFHLKKRETPHDMGRYAIGLPRYL